MSVYLVTGGAGFIGSHIVDHLVQQGEQVRVLDNFATGKLANLGYNLPRVDLLRGSVTDLNVVRRAVEGVDFVQHLAAVASVPHSVADPVACNETNIGGTLNVLVASKEAGVKRVVFASSSAVYGDTPDQPKVEDKPPCPQSPYALTKLVGEQYCQMFARLYGLETVILRYFNVFGPRQDPASEYAAVIPKFLTSMLSGKRPVVYGDGLQSRDFVYVSDVVRASVLACHKPHVEAQVFNIASGESLTLLDLVAAINRILGKSIEPVFEAPRPGDVKHSQADVSKAMNLLGFLPSVDLHDGLREMTVWFDDLQKSGGANQQLMRT